MGRLPRPSALLLFDVRHGRGRLYDYCRMVGTQGWRDSRRQSLWASPGRASAKGSETCSLWNFSRRSETLRWDGLNRFPRGRSTPDVTRQVTQMVCNGGGAFVL